MTINITKEIEAAYKAHLDEAVCCDVSGETTIRRRDTWPHFGSVGTVGLVEFAAGYQAGASGAAQDAKRYQWLRLNSYVEVYCGSPRFGTPEEGGASLDAAIDEAVEAQQRGSGT